MLAPWFILVVPCYLPCTLWYGLVPLATTGRCPNIAAEMGLVLENELTDCLPEEMNRNETSPSSISVSPFFWLAQIRIFRNIIKTSSKILGPWFASPRHQSRIGGGFGSEAWRRGALGAAGPGWTLWPAQTKWKTISCYKVKLLSIFQYIVCLQTMSNFLDMCWLLSCE